MIVCIVGPTGVGKTRLSEVLSVKYNAVIINSDAMQVYKKLDIGTAKYKSEEDCGAQHYLFDIVNPDENYTVYDYQKDAREVLDKIGNQNAIFVGGTGLYLKSALFNYEFSERETNSYDDLTNEQLYEMLKEQGNLDEIHINNRKRMISRLNSTGNNNLKDELLYSRVYFIGLTTDRENLYNKINNRVDEMMDEGLLDEVKYLYNEYGKVKSLTTGIGYKELIDYIDNKVTLEEAVDNIKQKSRKYAKRQYTWFNHQIPVKWFDTDYDDFYNTIKEVMDYIAHY